MRHFVAAAVLFFLTIPQLGAAEIASILTASATSSSPSSSSLTCILDAKCVGFWSPNARDNGNDEGIHIQFAEPTTIQFVSVSVAIDPGSGSSPNFQAYLEGKTVSAFTSLNSAPTVVATATLKKGKTDRSTLFLVGGRVSSDGELEKLVPLKSKVRSIYLKLVNAGPTRADAIKVTRIAFHGGNGDIVLDSAGIASIGLPIPLRLPKLALAETKATNTLEPVFAYDAYHLFDSQIDTAWATDGRKSAGAGEEVSVQFKEPQTLSGLLVWNGYQRSPAHFGDNARVQKLRIEAGGASQEVTLTNSDGKQIVKLSKELYNVNLIKLKVQSIYPGAKYKDLAISELRFLDATGNIVLPIVSPLKLNSPDFIAPVLDRSFSACLHGISEGSPSDCGGICDNVSLRIRSNGTFVIYKGSEILNGNWESKGDLLRIFGKRYESTFQSADYLQEKVTVPQAAVFQSELKFRAFNQMSEPDRKKAIYYHLKSAKRETMGQDKALYWTTGFMEAQEVKGQNEAALALKVEAELKKRNPFFIESSVFTGIVLPTEEVAACNTGC